MNFFGHSVVAAWCRPEPSFALGAMLPDLAQMLGRAHVGSSNEVLAAGIAYHHLTDKVFHGTQVFGDLEREAWQSLQRAGVPPGPRRALAHVGLEVLLDAELAALPECMAHYRRALESAESESLSGQLHWSPAKHVAQGAASEPGLLSLTHALLARAERMRPQNSDEALARLARVLEGRPRLRIPTACHAAVRAWLESTWPVLVRRLPEWLSELSLGLQQVPGATRDVVPSPLPLEPP